MHWRGNKHWIKRLASTKQTLSATLCFLQTRQKDLTYFFFCNCQLTYTLNADEINVYKADLGGRYGGFQPSIEKTSNEFGSLAFFFFWLILAFRFLSV